MRKRTLLPLLGLLIWSAGTALADTTVKRLAPGVTLTQEIDQKTPLIVNVVSVDLTAPGVRVGVGIGQDQVSGPDPSSGREDVSRLARRWGAVAAVNADFFPYTGDPLGVGIREGELFSEPFLGIHGGGPRVTFGLAPDGKGVFFDNLGWFGDLQAAGGDRAYLNGIDRPVGRNEIVVFSSLYGPTTANKPGGVEAVVGEVNLPVRANKLMTGRVVSVRRVDADTEAIPEGGVALSGGPGTGADFLARALHPGDPVSFVLAVAPVGQTGQALQIAGLPRTRGDLPSRAGAGISRSAWLWGQVREAVGGGPRLLVNGQVAVDWAAEGFDAGFALSLNPRTAIGVTRDGRHLLLVTVDGRQAFSRGVSLPDLALLLRRWGAWDAINLDGGGSTQMAVGGLTVSDPEGGGAERPVADMLLVYSDRAFQPDAPALPLAPDADGPRLLAPAGATAGGLVALKVRDGGREVSGASAGIVWQGPAGGVGFVNQKGYLVATTPGSGTIRALYKGRLLTAPITITGGATPAPVYTLRANLAPDPSARPLRNQLVVRITDADGKPPAAALVQIAVSGGAADQLIIQTDRDGTAVVGITWAAEGGGTARVSSGTLAPITLKQP